MQLELPKKEDYGFTILNPITRTYGWINEQSKERYLKDLKKAEDMRKETLLNCNRDTIDYEDWIKLIELQLKEVGYSEIIDKSEYTSEYRMGLTAKELFESINISHINNIK